VSILAGWFTGRLLRGGKNSIEATEGDERDKPEQSKSDFGDARFNMVHWKKLWPIRRFPGH
jgi:hypothetical protein